MISRNLQRLKDSGNFMALYSQGMSLLAQSGILEVLKELGRVRPLSPDMPNYQEIAAASAHWSLGYIDCINDLEYFRERYIDSTETVVERTMDYGAIEKAVESGDLTREEADGLQR